jgi:uncharacterized protein (TIGR02677 family)
LWRLPRDLFRFTTTDRADLHTAVMQVFGEANERLVTALTLDDVRAGLEGVGWLAHLDDDELGHTLKMLVAWQLLDVSQDHARQYASAEEYERKNLLYALTRRGEAAFDGVQHALVQLSATGALQAAVLDAIADRLASLHRLLSDGAGDDRRIYIALVELENHLNGLRTNTRQFNNELQRLLRDDAAEAAVFQDVKAATVAYLEDYLVDLETQARRIAEGIGRIEEFGVVTLHHRALVGADLPSLPGQDPAPRWLAQRAARWEGLQHWFRPDDGSRPRVEDLRGVAQRAIVSLLRILERLREARRRPTNTAADFRTLARWFAACPEEEDAHRLWNAAFGMWPARHAHLAADDPEATPAATAWADAPPVPVSPVLRARGRIDHATPGRGVRDTAALRRRRQAEAARQRSEVEAAWRALATDGRVRLSTFADLEHATFARLLELLGMALGRAPDRRGRHRATTSDGQLEVVLQPDGGGRAVLHTPLGRFDAPDYVVEIRSALSGEWPGLRQVAR